MVLYMAINAPKLHMFYGHHSGVSQISLDTLVFFNVHCDCTSLNLEYDYSNYDYIYLRATMQLKGNLHLSQIISWILMLLFPGLFYTPP